MSVVSRAILFTTRLVYRRGSPIDRVSSVPNARSFPLRIYRFWASRKNCFRNKTNGICKFFTPFGEFWRFVNEPSLPKSPRSFSDLFGRIITISPISILLLTWRISRNISTFKKRFNPCCFSNLRKPPNRSKPWRRIKARWVVSSLCGNMRRPTLLLTSYWKPTINFFPRTKKVIQ